MDTKVLMIIGFICLSIIVMIRTREYFASSDLSNTIPFTDSTTGNFAVISEMEFLLNELSKNPVYPSANSLVSAMGSTTYPMYSSDAEIEELFRKAYTDGESGLPERDRLLLREIAYFSRATLENMNTVIVYTTEGVPDFTSTVISESNKSVREFLFSILTSDYNNILPSRFARVPSTYNLDTDTDQQRVTWIAKAFSIPHAYITWLSENKWRLDMTWKPATCPASVTRTPSRITTVPGNTTFGPGTYTISELGNPTSINLSAPVKVVVNRANGSSTHEVKKSIGCRGIDATVTQMTGVTSVVVSLPT